jgi:holo-ACP synthase CitX
MHHNKTGELIHSVFIEGQRCIEDLLKEKHWAIRNKINLDEKAGYAAIYLVKVQPHILKTSTVYIEDQHALGRLFDIDVISDNKMDVPR